VVALAAAYIHLSVAVAASVGVVMVVEKGGRKLVVL
jgi:hypothetical protein